MLRALDISTLGTHYEVLSVKEDAGYEEIRAAYRSAVLNTHPDKAQKVSVPSRAHFQEQEFLDVQKAWEVLSDSKSREEYDKELQALRQESEVVADEVELGDMTVENTGEVQELLYLCRCGDYYSVNSLELREMGIMLGEDGRTEKKGVCIDLQPVSVLLPCCSCSLKIRLTIDAAYGSRC